MIKLRLGVILEKHSSRTSSKTHNLLSQRADTSARGWRGQGHKDRIGTWDEAVNRRGN